MGRYRAPQPKPSPYITGNGYKALEIEIQQIWQKRAGVTRALAAAAAEGDRSENAEYIYRKKELREIDRRIRYLQNRLPELNIVSQTPSDTSRIFFGAWIDIEDSNGVPSTYRIVGPDEINIKNNWISIDSPLAKALLGKKVDQDASVKTPDKTTTYYITGIRYTEQK